MKTLTLALLVAVCSITALSQSDPKQVNGGVLNGKAMSLPKPEYPESARNAGLEGAVPVAVVIDEAGNVISAVASAEPRKGRNAEGDEIEIPAADPILREAAERAAWQARFSPTTLSGIPVRVSGVIVYNFRAKGVPISDMPSGEGLMLNGKAISLPKPAYPPAARAVRAGGTVGVRLVLDEEGNVSSAEAISGHPLLRAAAVDAARQAKFSPTLIDGKAVTVKGVVIYNFVPPAPLVQ